MTSKILVFGSINIDQIFKVPNIVQPGETIASVGQELEAGGKGANQSVAIARAGGNAYHLGRMGTDGQFILDLMQCSGVHTNLIQVTDKEFTGRAIIQLCQKTSENAIILSANTNYTIDMDQIAKDLDQLQAGAGDWLLLQNEVLGNEKMIEIAKAKGIRTVFNPAPMTPSLLDSFNFNNVDILIVNQIEFASLFEKFSSDFQHDGKNIEQRCHHLLKHEKFSSCSLLLVTLGASGVLCAYRDATSKQFEIVNLSSLPPKDQIKDTTGAGDTFIGYFLTKVATLAQAQGNQLTFVKNDLVNSLQFGMAAASIGITRFGAMNSIPKVNEVENFLV